MSDFQLHTPETDAGLRRPFVEVAVVMRRERIDNRWQPWRWSLSEIIPHEDGFGSSPRLLQAALRLADLLALALCCECITSAIFRRLEAVDALLFWGWGLADDFLYLHTEI